MAIRAVNSGGIATQNIVVDGEVIGHAVAGYTTLADAYAGAVAGDTIIATEAFEDALTAFEIDKANLYIDVADWARGNKNRYGSGYRISNGDALDGAILIRKPCTIKNLQVACEVDAEYAIQVKHQDGTVTLDRCIVIHDGNGTNTAPCIKVATVDLPDLPVAPVLEIWNCVVHNKAGDPTGDAAINDETVGDTTINIRNCVVYVAQAGCKGIVGDSAATVKACNTIVIAPDTCYTGVGAIGGGFNSDSGDASAPGTTVYTVTTAAFVSVVAGSENFHWVDRATMLTFPGVSQAASFTKDIDGERRLNWYIGSDWVTHPISAGGQVGGLLSGRRAGMFTAAGG